MNGPIHWGVLSHPLWKRCSVGVGKKERKLLLDTNAKHKSRKVWDNHPKWKIKNYKKNSMGN